MPYYTQAQLDAQLKEQQCQQELLMRDDDDEHGMMPLDERMALAAKEKQVWEQTMGIQQHQQQQQHMLGQIQSLMSNLDTNENQDGDGDMDTEMESGSVRPIKSSPIAIPQFIYHDSADEIPPLSNSPSLGSIAPPSETQLMTSCPSCGIPNYSFQYEQLFHQHVGSCYINKHVKTPNAKPLPGIAPQVNKQHLINQIRDAVSKLDVSQRESLMDAFKKLSGAGQNGNQQSIAHVLSMLYTPATQAQNPTNSPSHFSLEASQSQSRLPPPPPPQYLDPQFYAHQLHLYDNLDGTHQPQQHPQQAYPEQPRYEQKQDFPESNYPQPTTQPDQIPQAPPLGPPRLTQQQQQEISMRAGMQPFWQQSAIPPQEREYHHAQHAAYVAQQEAYYREQEEIYAQQHQQQQVQQVQQQQQQQQVHHVGSYSDPHGYEYDESYDETYDEYGYPPYPPHPAYPYHHGYSTESTPYGSY